MASRNYRVNYNKTTRVVRLESSAGAAPAAIGGAYTDAGTFKHGDGNDDSLPGMQTLDENHVLYHHVRERLYFVNEQNMQHLSIILDGVRTISIGLGTLTVAAGANSPALTLTTVPADATDRQLVFTSSDVTKATVNSAGVVHGVAAGSAVITAKLASDNTIQATRNVTVTA